MSPALEAARWFAKEVHAHDSSLRAYLRGSFPAVKEVDDVVQESYLRIWKARTGHPIACARGFLFRVARNVAINLLNRERNSPLVPVKDLAALAVVEDRPNAATAASLHEELSLLAHAIDALPARCREIVILRRIKHVSQKEIAARLGIAEETVEVQVARGVKRCGEYLKRHGVRFDHETRL
ncbi:MAG: sigma-70 family RNA polymerase sigma factor [Opitutaceae bacterium]|nr:sigma-70 family RNA polymerase sigma factor [Opitutaceae bacterium]